MKQLPEVEKTWVLLPNDYRDVKNASGDVMYRIKECVDDFEYKFADCETGKTKNLRSQKSGLSLTILSLPKNRYMRSIKK